MKVGKISESVLKRSVLKQLKNKNGKIRSGAGVGADCALLACKDGFFAASAQTAVLKKAADIRYVIHKAANNAACSGAAPTALLLTLLLPIEAEETYLAEIMREADKAAGTLGMQITGGHTEVTAAVSAPVVSVSAYSYAEDTEMPRKAAPGQDVVVSKWIGLEGTARIAESHREELLTRYPFHMIEEAAAFDRYLSVIPEAATAFESNVGAVHDVSTGGIFAAFWEIAESAGVGLEIDLKKIPVRQETIEVCEFFGISPYELLSGGSLLMTADNGEALVQALQSMHIPATVVGRVTDNHDRVIINEDEKRFLERPKTDEMTKIEKEIGYETRIAAYY